MADKKCCGKHGGKDGCCNNKNQHRHGQNNGSCKQDGSCNDKVKKDAANKDGSTKKDS